MRTLTADQRESVDIGITMPRYLIETALSEPLYLSTRGDVVVDSIFYQGGCIEEGSLDLGEREATFKICNNAYQYTRGAVTGAYQRNAVRIFSCYALPETDSVGKIQVFDGFIDQVSDLDEMITVRCRRTLPKTYPARQIRPPEFNHLPSPGMVISWDGATYRIEE